MCFFRKSVVGQNSQHVFFPKIGRRPKFTKCVFSENRSSAKIHKMCFSENRSDEISEKCARPAGQRKIVGFCVHIILQGSTSREIRICPTTKMSCFDKMSEFFRRPRFSAKHILCASAFFRVYKMCVHTFLSDTKNVHKIPKCGPGVIGRRKFVGFCEKCILQGSAFHEIWEFPTMKIVTFDKMSEFFRRTHFSAKHVLCTSTVFRVYERCAPTFFVGHKKFAQNPEMCARDCRPGKNCRFLCKVHSSGERIL